MNLRSFAASPLRNTVEEELCERAIIPQVDDSILTEVKDSQTGGMVLLLRYGTETELYPRDVFNINDPVIIDIAYQTSVTAQR